MKPWISRLLSKALFFYCLFFSNPLFSSTPSSYLFVENKGQWPAEVLFRADIPGGQLFVKANGLSYFFYDTEALSSLHTAGKATDNSRMGKAQIRTSKLDLILKNSKKPQIQTGKATSASYNFYQGNDKSKWISGARAFEEIQLKDVYPNIDLRLHSTGDVLKYEYIVHPNADPGQIKMIYNGQQQIRLENGQLLLKTAVNQLKEYKPYTYQGTSRARQSVGSSFILRENEISFDIASYDLSKDLIIDPELVFSTYSGSFSDNWSHTATYDDQGNLYAGGSVFGPNFPATPSSFQTETGGSDESFGLITDVVIMKFSADGSKLLYATYLGGISSEVPHSMICNSKGDLVVMGTTSSPDFPVTSNAFQTDFKGGLPLYNEPITTGIDFEYGTDIFLAVIAEDGTSLKGSTFVGGNSNDGIHDYRAFLIQNYGDEYRGEVYLDEQDHIYVASISTSEDFPVKLASSPKISSGYDGVVFEMSPDLGQMLWGTYLGGKRYDAAYGIRVNKEGDVFVVGSTLSQDLQTTSGVYQKNYVGEADAFIARFSNHNLTALTYVGTKEEDLGSMIDLDPDGNVCIFGLSTGKYPINGTVYQNPGSGQFIHTLTPDLKQTVFSTVFGTGNGVGTVDLVPTAFLVNDCGNIYVAGWGGKINSDNGYNPSSTTSGLPVTRDAFRSETTGSNYYIAIFETGAKSLLYATFFGSEAPPTAEDERGDHLDGGTCRFDKNGIIYHSACVCKARGGFVSFPTQNGYEENHNSGNCNMAGFKFDIDALTADFDILNGEEVNPLEVCAGTKIKLGNKSKGGITYEWSLDKNVFSRQEDPNLLLNVAGEYQIKLEAFNTITCAVSDSTFRSIKVIPFESGVSADTTVCEGSEVLLRAFGGETYSWSPSTLFVNNTDSVVRAIVNETTTFSVQIKNEKCNVTKEVTASVENTKSDFIVSNDLETCAGRPVTLSALGDAEYFVWSGPGMKDTTAQSVTVSANQTTLYTVKAFYADGCKPSENIQVSIDKSFMPDFDYGIHYDCGKPFELRFNNLSAGGGSYIWYMGNGDSLLVDVPEGYKYAAPGEYKVKLIASNEIGCRLESIKPVNIPEDDGIIPNAISPNNDGKNDTFVIGITGAKLNIYNRWGKLLYEMEEYDNSWGPGVQSGVYYYEIVMTDGNNCKGWVEVFE